MRRVQKLRGTCGEAPVSPRGQKKEEDGQKRYRTKLTTIWAGGGYGIVFRRNYCQTKLTLIQVNDHLICKLRKETRNQTIHLQEHTKHGKLARTKWRGGGGKVTKVPLWWLKVFYEVSFGRAGTKHGITGLHVYPYSIINFWNPCGDVGAIRSRPFRFYLSFRLDEGYYRSICWRVDGWSPRRTIMARTREETLAHLVKPIER